MDGEGLHNPPDRPAGPLDMPSAAEREAPLAAAEWLGQIISEIPLPLDELARAKVRVGGRLLAEIESSRWAPVDKGPMEWRRKRRGSVLLRGLVTAALLMILLSLSIGILRASANALPSSPLYAIKRSEEKIALHTAWSDQRHGDVLAVIARRRLNEALREAELDHLAEARSLTRECASDTVAIIELAGAMASHHQDIQALSLQLTYLLTAQQDAARAAAQAGNQDMADALYAAGQAAREALDRNHVVLPGALPRLDGGLQPTTIPSQAPLQPQHTPGVSPTPGSTGHIPGTQGNGFGGKPPAEPGGQRPTTGTPTATGWTLLPTPSAARDNLASDNL